jgi:hypothetical protein
MSVVMIVIIAVVIIVIAIRGMPAVGKIIIVVIAIIHIISNICVTVDLIAIAGIEIGRLIIVVPEKKIVEKAEYHPILYNIPKLHI